MNKIVYIIILFFSFSLNATALDADIKKITGSIIKSSDRIQIDLGSKRGIKVELWSNLVYGLTENLRKCTIRLDE